MEAPRQPHALIYALSLTATLCLSVVGAGCTPYKGVVLGDVVHADPKGDEFGPGTYQYPQGAPFPRGSFDLVSLRLIATSQELLVIAKMARPIYIQRGVRLSREQVEDLFAATVDVYLDFDGIEGSGTRDGLPGRNVEMAGGLGWELALVLSPISARIETLLAHNWRGNTILVAERVRVVGKELRASFPIEALQGQPLESMGVAAAVTSTVFSTTFRVLVPGEVSTGFARTVTIEPGRCDRHEEQIDGTPCTFGGCTGCDRATRVLDALAEDSESQIAHLSGVLEEGSPNLPIRFPDGRSTPAQPFYQRIQVPVTDRRLDIITALVDSDKAPRPGVLVDGLDADGEIIGTLVLNKVLGNGVQVPAIFSLLDGSADAVVVLAWRYRSPPPPR